MLFHSWQVTRGTHPDDLTVGHGDDYHRRKVMPAELDAAVIAAWRASSISTPLFRKTHGLGEQRRYAIQHTLRHQIWELDQPHYLHVHGRSLHGHSPDPEETARFAALREEFTADARYTAD